MNKTIFLLFASIMLMSCTKDEVNDNDLDGEWILTNVYCFCFFEEDYDFSASKIVINSNQNKITITNDGDADFIDESGTYNYTIDDGVIVLKERSYTFEVKDSMLTLAFIDSPDIADDEIVYTFIKN